MANAAQRRFPSTHPGRNWRLGPPSTRFSLRVDLGAALSRSGERLPLATVPCRSVVRNDWSALWLGPDEQLLIGPEPMASAFAIAADEALRGVPHSLVDVSHRQCSIQISGPHASDLLSAGCPLDLDIECFPVGACTRTILAKSEIVLWRRADEQFHIEVWRSFVAYLGEYLASVEQEFLGQIER